MGSPSVVGYSLAEFFGFEDIWINGGSSGEYLTKLPYYNDVTRRRTKLYDRNKEGESVRQYSGRGKKIVSRLKEIGERIGKEVGREKRKEILEKMVAGIFIVFGFFMVGFNISVTGAVIGGSVGNVGGAVLFIGLFYGLFLFIRGVWVRFKR